MLCRKRALPIAAVVVVSLFFVIRLIQVNQRATTPLGVLEERPANVVTPWTLRPTVPSPRLTGPVRDWNSMLESNKLRGQAFHCEGSSTKPILVLLGDSIFETFYGTVLGHKVQRAVDMEQVWQMYSSFQTLVLAIAGDQTQHLLYRLPLELPSCVRTDASATFLVLIGTNNLGAHFDVASTVKGIQAVVTWLLEHTQGHVLLLELLPRCDHDCHLKTSVNSVNAELHHFRLKRLELSSCGETLLEEGELIWDLMPDGLHPNAKGHLKLAACLLNTSLNHTLGDFGDK